MPHQKVHKTRCHCIALRRAAGAVTEYYDRVMEASGVTVGQYSILINLWRMEEASTSALAEKLGLDRTTLARNLKPLMEQGLITDLSKAGARNRRLAVSASGQIVLNRARPAWETAQRGIQDALGAENTALLMELLYRLQDL